MTKVAVLGDAHWGARSDSPTLLKHQRRFYEEIFFPEIKKRGITTIIQVGDLVDRRKNIAFTTLKDGLYEGFLKPIIDNNLEFIWYPGNHDIPFKNTVSYSSLAILMQLSGSIPPNFRLITAPQDVEVLGHQVAIFPWICDDNQDASYQLMATSKARIAFGHFELAGFSMNPGHVSTHGMDSNLLSRFDKVISGHYHTESIKGKFHYVRIPYELTWSDYGDPKGFHILDLDTLEVETIDNPNTLHHKIYYDERRADFKSWVDGDFSEASGKYVKLIVQFKKTRNAKIQKVIEAIETSGALALQVIDVPSQDEAEQQVEVESNFEFKDLIRRKIEKTDLDVDKDALLQRMLTRYQTAVEIIG